MKDSMKLLQEANFDMSSASSDDKNLFLEGIMMQMGIVNKNGRRYHPDVIAPIVDQYIKEQVETGSAVGEADHPTNPNLNIARISHRIVSLKREGNDYIGKSLVLDTPMGNVVKGLHRGGVRTGMSTRALGKVTLTQEGVEDVGAPFVLVTIGDIVMSPSAPEAYTQAVCENKEWVIGAEGKWVGRIVEETKKAIHAAPAAQLQKVTFESFQRFLRAIGTK